MSPAVVAARKIIELVADCLKESGVEIPIEYMPHDERLAGIIEAEYDSKDLAGEKKTVSGITLLEFVNEATVVMRHPVSADAVRKFFADANGSTVSAFTEGTESGYIFFTPETEESGKYFKLVTAAENVDQARVARLARQCTYGEWITGKFTGRPHRVTPVEIIEAP
jgi:hypothetical protein